MGLWGNSKKTPEPEASALPADPLYGKPQPPTVETPPPPAAPAFGIDQTITLMRSLPHTKDPTLVVAVMKATLESVNVHVSDIIEDATRRLADVERRVAELKAENEAFEREMDRRAKEIVQLEEAHAEVTRVRAFLASDATPPK